MLLPLLPCDQLPVFRRKQTAGSLFCLSLQRQVFRCLWLLSSSLLQYSQLLQGQIQFCCRLWRHPCGFRCSCYHEWWCRDLLLLSSVRDASRSLYSCLQRSGDVPAQTAGGCRGSRSRGNARISGSPSGGSRCCNVGSSMSGTRSSNPSSRVSRDPNRQGSNPSTMTSAIRGSTGGRCTRSSATRKCHSNNY